MALLEIEDLYVRFPTRDGVVKAVDGISFSVDRGQTLGVVGESGSGKSVTALTVMGLSRSPSTEIEGHVRLDGVDLVPLESSELRDIRGKRVAMIFQDPMSSLHPLYKVGWQIEEAIRAHENVSRKVARARALEALREVGIPSAAERLDAYPHELSGGMRQRVMIAIALVLDPDVLIADEPTTALDVTVQAQILELIARLQGEFGTTVILITHDLGIVADVADDVAVMYGGRIVELASTATLYDLPEMPYTLGLLSSVPRMDKELPERLDPIRGNPPSPISLPKGCVFEPRCNYSDRTGGASKSTRPELLESRPDHFVRCHLPAEERQRISKEVLRLLEGDAP